MPSVVKKRAATKNIKNAITFIIRVEPEPKILPINLPPLISERISV